MVPVSNQNVYVDDFTVGHYRAILETAVARYRFVDFGALRDSGHVLYWRHDCDYSLERSGRIAEVEAEFGVRSTFFLNPHCRFYSLLERSQAEIVRKITRLGHSIGLHFDAGFYGVGREEELDALVAEEASWLRTWFDTEIAAFSFHNPNDLTLACGQDTYGGLINCYSDYFKNEVGYCSDSNGYWRHDRIIDVVARDPQGPLQILTHPGWWQERPMFPRARIMRCVQGRARSVMADYDDALVRDGRANHSGPAGNLRVIASHYPDVVAQLDVLWNAGRLDLVYFGLVRLLAAVNPREAVADEILSSLLNGVPIATGVLEEACVRLSTVIASREAGPLKQARDLE